MTDFYHAPGPRGLLGPRALCGATFATEPDNTLRLHEPGPGVTCVRCRELMLGGAE